jgi:thiol-disulfide isomerase/thioredoxin
MRSARVVRTSLACLAAFSLLLVGAWPALAQDDDEAPVKPAASLKVGDKAPPLTVEKWIKGQPVEQFEKGQVYVVEFWATWCGPCIRSMPHLSALQKQYKDKGVTIIGTNISEDSVAPYTSETLARVEEFVKEQGNRMSYSVAYDGKTKATDQAYMKAAGQVGIPAAFLVDKSGTIAWIGHPMWLDLPLEQVVADKWDPKTGPQQLTKAQAHLNEVFEKLQTSAKDAIAVWESFEKEYPAVAAHMSDMKFRLLLGAEEYDKAYQVATKLVDGAIADKDADTLNALAWEIVDPEGSVAKKDLDLALKAATKADEFTGHKNAAIIDTLARVYFLKGDVDKAIELQSRAVELAPEHQESELRRALEEYKKAKAGKQP